VILEKWSTREITSKTEADAVFDDLRKTIRAGTFDRRVVEPPREVSPQTFRQFAEPGSNLNDATPRGPQVAPVRRSGPGEGEACRSARI
jgi:hypothetical protein